jgi:hypothetical protein
MFLVLLFSQPFLPATSSEANSTQAVAVFVDNSFSMQAPGSSEDTPILVESIKEALQLSSVFSRSVDFTLLENSFRNYSKASGQSDFINQANAIDLTARARTSASTVSKINQVLETQNRASARSFWFSDFQKSTFQAQAFEKADSTVSYQLVHMPTAADKNVFIDTLEIEDVFIRANEINSLQAVIRNTGAEEATTNVKFFMGSQQVSSVDVAIPANGSNKIRFNFKFEGNQEQLCRLVLDDYPITFDNEYYFLLSPSADVKVVSFSKTGRSAVDQVLSSEPIFKLKSLAGDKVNYADVAQADLMVINGLQTIDPGFADNVKRQVMAGSSVLVIPAGDADKASYLKMLQSFGIRSVSWAEQTEMQPVAVPNLQNPFFANIFEQLPKDIETPKAKAMLGWSRSADDILRFKSGGAYLSQFKVGEGNVFLLASPLETSYSDFSSNALFVPVMYKLAMRSQRNTQQLAYTFGQSVLELPLVNTSEKERIFKLVKDSVEWIPDQRLAGKKLILTVPGELAEAGFYQLTAQDGKVERTLAFNNDKRESLLEQYSFEELKSLMQPYKNVKVVQANAGNSFAEAYEKQNKGQPLWKYCLIICLLALAAETAVIRFMK